MITISVRLENGMVIHFDAKDGWRTATENVNDEDKEFLYEMEARKILMNLPLQFGLSNHPLIPPVRREIE